MDLTINRGLIPWALAASLGGIACSDASNSSPRALPKAGTSVQSAPPQVVGLGSPPPTVEPLRDSATRILAIHVQPSPRCTITPQGLSNDPAHTALVSASDGNIYLLPPPTDWGSKLTVGCNVGGTAIAPVAVDLNDPATFEEKSVSDVAPRQVGVRQPLTGDPSSMSLEDLLAKGYPPRPDPATAPDRYAAWVKQVSQPINAYAGDFINALGGAHGGSYEGTNPGCDSNWTGFVQTGGGFTADSMGSLNANYGTFYEAYVANMLVPGNFGCAAGDGCLTFIWSGIGGYRTYYPLGGVVQGSLLQSGFAVSGGSTTSPPPGVWLYAEFIFDSSHDSHGFLPLPGGTNTFDTGVVWAWASDTPNCTDINAQGGFGCYYWADTTGSGWQVGPGILARPNGAAFPSTMEYVVEAGIGSSGRVSNAFYWADTMTGGAFDTSGAYHADPGTGADPYIYSRQDCGAVNKSYWSNSNASVSPAVDPMVFVWQNY